MQICTDSQAWLAKKAGVLQVGVEISTAVLVARAPQPGGSGYYYIWDADDNPLNDLPTVTGIDQLRQRCEDFGLRILRLPGASVVDSVLRPLLQDAGYDLSRGSGVPLGMDYNMRNDYQSLDDASTAVTDVFAELHDSFGYQGDHESDQTGDKQHLAGFGWARSEADVGVEDWGFQHPMQALICMTPA